MANQFFFGSEKAKLIDYQWIRYKQNQESFPTAFIMNSEEKRVMLPSFERAQVARPVLDLVFFMDVTGSMGSWIERARRAAQCVCKQLSIGGLDVQMSVVAYRDVQDRKRFEIKPFTANGESVSTFLSKLVATGGGDWPEDVIGGLQEVARLKGWRPNSARMILWIADAPPHGHQFHTRDYGDDHPNYPMIDHGVKEPEGVIRHLAEEMKTQLVVLRLNDELDKTCGVFSEWDWKVHKTEISNQEVWKFAYMISHQLVRFVQQLPARSQEEPTQYLQPEGANCVTNTFLCLRRGLSSDVLFQHLEACYARDPVMTTRLILYCRDRKGTVKEKKLGRQAWWWLRKKNPVLTNKCLTEFVIDSGCVVDLLHLAQMSDEKAIEERKRTREEPMELRFLAACLVRAFMSLEHTEADAEILRCINNGAVSRLAPGFNPDPHFLAKWAPREKSRKQRQKSRGCKKTQTCIPAWKIHEFARRLAQMIFLREEDIAATRSLEEAFPDNIHPRLVLDYFSPPKRYHRRMWCLYKQLLRRLKTAPTVENLMCQRQWQAIVKRGLDKFPTLAVSRRLKAWGRHIPEELERITSEKKVKATTVQGHEMVKHFVVNRLRQDVEEQVTSHLEDDFVNAQWETYQQQLKGKLELRSNSICMVNLNGSMVMGDPMPYAAAIALMFQLSCRPGPFQNLWMTWDLDPRFAEIKGATLKDMVNSTMDIGGRTQGNVARAFEKTLLCQPRPETFFVLTNCLTSAVELKEIQQVRSKYVQPGDKVQTKVVLWNLCTDSDEVTFYKPKDLGDGIHLISGHSPILLSAFATGRNLDEFVMEQLTSAFPLQDVQV